MGLLLIGGVWLITRQSQQAPAASGSSSQPAGEAGSTTISRPAHGSEEASREKITKSQKPMSGQAPLIERLSQKQKEEWARLDPAAKRARVAETFRALRRIYGHAGALSWEDAKALIEAREKAEEDLVDRLASLGPGGAKILAEVYPSGPGTREQMLVIRALGQIEDTEAAQVLDSLLAAEQSHSMRKEMVMALGRRDELASSQVLANVLANEQDDQVRFASAQALSRNVDSVPLLAQQLHADPSPNVQKELIHSLGKTGTDSAMSALESVALSQKELSVRQTAIQELARSFGAKSLHTLNSMLGDSDPAIRENVVSAIATIKTEEAVAILKQVATSDPSRDVRSRAQIAVTRSAK